MPRTGRFPASFNPFSCVAAIGTAGVVALCVVFAASAGAAQAPVPTGTAPGAAASKPASARTAASAAKSPTTKRITKPTWAELTPAQRTALAPLAGTWDSVSETQKRKWIALSANFLKIPATEQGTMHSRMSEWAALSPAQRTQARLNFGETQQLSPDDKKAKWEAYQALPPEEKRKLRADATKQPGTAAAVKPVAPEKLAVVPKSPPKREAKAPRIAVAPNQPEHSNPLPAPGTPPLRTN